MNRVLVEAELGSMFVTVFLGWYEIASAMFRYANAGHPLPYLFEPGGRVRPALRHSDMRLPVYKDDQIRLLHATQQM